jgi:Flp pilus assembly protein TadG
MIRDFLRDDGANVALMFGVLALPVFTAAGLAVDYSEISRVRTEMQTVADGAALAAAIHQGSVPEQIKVVSDYVKQATALKGGPTVLSVKTTQPGEAQLRVEITGQIRTSVLSLAGYKTIDFTVTSESFRGFSNDMEVVFALDNTGSMGVNNKITTLRKAAKSLVTLLASPNDGRVKFGIVPFSSYVNVGLNNRNASWLSVPADGPTGKDFCWNKLISESDCSITMVKKSVCDDVCVLKDVPEKKCNIQVREPNKTCTPVKTRWFGCVGSRPFPLNVSTEQPEMPYPGIMDTGCAASLLPLTADVKPVLAKIDSMSANGSTYIPAGLVWALNLLTPGAPASLAKPFDPSGENRNPRKSLILMTDGENSMVPTWTGTKAGSHIPILPGMVNDTATANHYTAMLCDSAKKLDIEVFTISFLVTDPVTKDMLAKCATDEAHFFDADNSAELMFAFTDIAGTLRKVRLSK